MRNLNKRKLSDASLNEIHFSELTNVVQTKSIIPNDFEPDLDVVLNSTISKFRNIVSFNNNQEMIVDAHEYDGGLDQGPSPYDLLLASLGACTSITIQMYIFHKRLSVKAINVEIMHQKMKFEHIPSDLVQYSAHFLNKNNENLNSMIDVYQRNITLHEDSDSPLTTKQKENLLRIANCCPIHKMLEKSGIINTKLI
eukprot:gene5718-7893_t